MYTAVHAEALQVAGMRATTVLELGLAGSSDPEVFAAAITEEAALLTENVADFSEYPLSTCWPACTIRAS